MKREEEEEGGRGRRRRTPGVQRDHHDRTFAHISLV